MPFLIVFAILLGGGAYLATRKKPAAIVKAAPKPVVKAAAQPAQKAPAVPYTRPILAGAATVAPHMPIPKVSKIAKAGKIVRLNQAAIISPPVISAVVNLNPTSPSVPTSPGAAANTATGALTGAVGGGVKGLTTGALANINSGTGSGDGSDDGSDTGDN